MIRHRVILARVGLARVGPSLVGLALVGVLMSPAAAQPDDGSSSDDGEGIELSAEKFDASTCAKLPTAAASSTAAPVTWSGFEIKGTLPESGPTVRALFEPTMSRYRAMTEDAREDVRRVSTAYGYHLIQVTDRKEGSPVDFEQKKPLIMQLYSAELQKEILAAERPKAKIDVKDMPPDLFPPAPANAPAQGTPKPGTPKGAATKGAAPKAAPGR